MFKVMNDNQVKSIRRFDEFEAMAQREIVEDVEKVRKLKSEDRNYLNRYVVAYKFKFVILFFFHPGFSFIYVHAYTQAVNFLGGAQWGVSR